MESLTPAVRRGLADEVTDRLRSAILDGVLQPGERAGEAELSRMLSVSRGPVREALVRLEQEGLVRPVLGDGEAPITRRRTTRGAPRVIYEPIRS